MGREGKAFVTWVLFFCFYDGGCLLYYWRRDGYPSTMLVLLRQDLPSLFVVVLQGSFDQKGIVWRSCMTSVHTSVRKIKIV